MMRRLVILLALALPVSLSAQSQDSTGPLFPIFVDGVSGGIQYRSALKIIPTTPGTPPMNCTLTQRGPSSALSAPLVGVGGYLYTTDVFDSVGSLASTTLIYLSQLLPWELLRSQGTGAQGTGALESGYASLACPSSVHTELQVSLFNLQGAKLGETSVPPATLGTSFEFLINTQDGTRLAFSLVNDSGVGAFNAGQFEVIARDQYNYVATSQTYSLGAYSQYTSFVDELPGLGLPPNFVGSIEIVGVAGGNNYVLGLQYTGQVFATLSPVVRSAPLPLQHF